MSSPPINLPLKFDTMELATHCESLCRTIRSADPEALARALNIHDFNDTHFFEQIKYADLVLKKSLERKSGG